MTPTKGKKSQAVKRGGLLMNGTSVIYSHVAYSACLPFLGGLVAPALGVLVYRYVRRRLGVKEGSKSRAYLFYRVLSGVLLGQFVCHTNIQPDADLGLYFPFLFILSGYLAMDAAESIARVWNTNVAYIGPLDEQVDDDVALNREKMQENTVVVATNVGSSDFADVVWTAEDAAKDKVKRRWMLGCLLVVLSFIAVTDGMLLVFRNPQTTISMISIVVFYFVNGVSMTVAVYGGMVHAKLMIIQEDRWRIFWNMVLGGFWCVVLICSSIPMLAGAQLSVISIVLRSKGYSAVYGLTAGCVLRLQQYFHHRNVDKIDKTQTAWSIIVFIVAAGQAAVTGLSL